MRKGSAVEALDDDEVMMTTKKRTSDEGGSTREKNEASKTSWLRLACGEFWMTKNKRPIFDQIKKTINTKNTKWSTDENHKNGIDRFDNNNGYEINNVNCCCGECNYMKKDYNYNAILDKFSMIYEIHKNDVMENIDDENNRVISKSNKKPKPQVIENTKIRKERQQKELKERYNNEEYKVNRSLEIAKSRKDKKETI